MTEAQLERRCQVGVPASELRDWHFRPGAFERLSPPWEKTALIEAPESIHDGAQAVIEIGVGPFKRHWVAEHELTEDGFVDRQSEGPFAFWEHEHRFRTLDESSSELVDSIRYRLPLGIPGKIFGGPLMRWKLDKLFSYRHAITQMDLERNRRNPPPRSLELLVTGASGFIGTALCAFLKTQGHSVRRITRKPVLMTDIGWDPMNGIFDLPDNLAIDGVIDLAGENIADGRWSPPKKQCILESREQGTRLLVQALTRREQKPTVLVCLSGANFYPANDGLVHSESDAGGIGFLSEVCRIRETETRPALDAGIRVVLPRPGVVLDPRGGALARLVPLFLSGLGGRIGNGRQHLSWIALDDVLDLLHRTLFEAEWSGPINFTAPAIVTNREFTASLAKTLARPALLPVPAPVLRAVFGEMAEETLLADLSVAPRKLESFGYEFRYPRLDEALSHLFGKPPSAPA